MQPAIFRDRDGFIMSTMGVVFNSVQSI